MSSSIEKGHGWLLIAVCTSLFCMPFMMAGVNAVLPPIGESLNASVRELGLMGAFYAMGLAVFQLASGSLGDIWGYRRIFILGTIIFGISGALLGFVTSVEFFLGLRLVQGMGGAMFNACGLALLASAAPAEKRPIYLGYSGAAVYAGIACGPPVAGFVAGWLGWRWLFWGNALTSVGVLLLMKYFVKLDWRTAKGRPFDWTGCFIYGLAMTALTFGSSELAGYPVMAGCLLGAFVVLMVIFCIKELRSEFPILDVRMLARNRVFALSSLAAFINYSSFFGILFFFSLYLQFGLGMTVQQAGMFLALQSVVQALTTPVAARLCLRFNPGHVSAVGVGLCGLGLLVSAFLEVDSPIGVLLAAQGLLGVGISLFALPNTTIILESAGPEHVGQASGLTGAVRTAGQLVNMAVITLTLGFFLGDRPAGPDTVDAFMKSMHLDLIVFGVLNLLAVGCVLARNRN
ncbi:MFS transporter [Desulfovibrio sp.]|uniref:MFS transporter n=1 Tax=Desulfovibrio sp. TaxID=885 RepID=UPI0025C0F278|nr:MFS transporter [Desulfovibrio sp.]